jgi:cell division protein FtsL
MIRASSILFWFALTILVSVALYSTSYRVHDLNLRLRSLNTEIATEQRTIHVLKAEWVYLANPARIEMAARKYLAMNPTSVSQIAKLEDIPDRIPLRADAPKTERIIAVVTRNADNERVNTRVNFQRTASAAPLPADTAP